MDFITHCTKLHIDCRLCNMQLGAVVVLSTSSSSSSLGNKLSQPRLHSARYHGGDSFVRSLARSLACQSHVVPSNYLPRRLGSGLRRRGAVLKHVLSAGRRQRTSDISGMFERFIGFFFFFSFPLLIQRGLELRSNSRLLLPTCVSEAGK